MLDNRIDLRADSNPCLTTIESDLNKFFRVLAEEVKRIPLREDKQ